MTDNEIIKAWECHLGVDPQRCKHCKYTEYGFYCLDHLHADLLSLINRQQSTINKITEKTQAELQQALDSRRNHIRESGFRGSFVLYYNGKIRALRNISNFISETTKAGEQSCP